MIKENTIDGLIPCQERMIYGESLLYYDITSRQSIQSILEAQPLQMRHLQKLFSGLRTISEVMEKYLLSPEDLLLLPEFVYMDMATGEYSFIYYPERMGEKNRGTQWRGNVNSRSRNEGIQEQHIAEHWMMQGKGQEQKDTRNFGIRETAMQDVRFPKSEEKKSLWRRLVEWAFPNFKINKKEYTVDSSRYVRYQDVTEPEKIPQPDDSGHTVIISRCKNCQSQLEKWQEQWILC